MEQHQNAGDRTFPSRFSSSPISSRIRIPVGANSEDTSSSSFIAYHSHSQSIADYGAYESPTPINQSASMIMSCTMDEDAYEDNANSGREKKSRARSTTSRRKRITTSASVIVDDRFLQEADYKETEDNGRLWVPFPLNETFEEHLVLRIHDRLAERLRQQEISFENLEFEFTEERYGLLRIKESDESFPMVLVDLPCIIETQRACTERKTYYKISDICQMLLICEESNFPTIDAYLRANSYSWPHGMAPPLKNVRNRRFRKTGMQAYKEEVKKIEQAVSDLIQSDKTAINVEHELCDISKLSGARPDDSLSAIEDGDLSDDSDLAAEIEYGLMEEDKPDEEPSLENGSHVQAEGPSSVPAVPDKESDDFSFLQKSLSARLRMVKAGGTRQQAKSPAPDAQKGVSDADVSSDIIMLFEDIGNG